MTLDEHADRIRRVLDGDPRVVEKKAFGGIMFLLNGNMLVSIKKDGQMLVHVARDDNDAALARDGASQMVHGEKTMKGFVWVEPYALEDDGDLAGWISFAAQSTAKLPPK